MKALRLINHVLILAAIFILAGCGDQASWYDFGNGKINLSQVSIIRPVMDYEFTLSTDEPKDVGRDYSEPMTEDSVNKVLSLLNKEEMEKHDFYRIKFSIYVMFDTFRLGLFESEDYVKKPSKYQINDYLLSELKSNGADKTVMEAVTSLNGKVFSSEEEFKSALAATDALNMGNWWVASVLPKLGLGESGAKFVEQVKDSNAELILDEKSISTLRDSIESALDSYDSIPAK